MLTRILPYAAIPPLHPHFSITGGVPCWHDTCCMALFRHPPLHHNSLLCHMRGAWGALGCSDYATMGWTEEGMSVGGVRGAMRFSGARGRARAGHDHLRYPIHCLTCKFINRPPYPRSICHFPSLLKLTSALLNLREATSRPRPQTIRRRTSWRCELLKVCEPNLA